MIIPRYSSVRLAGSTDCCWICSELEILRFHLAVLGSESFPIQGCGLRDLLWFSFDAKGERRGGGGPKFRIQATGFVSGWV